MLPPQSERFAGLWMFGGPTSAGHCHGLEVYPDAQRGPGFFANFLHWKPGRLGCETSSSDISRVELQGKTSANGALELSGRVARNVPDSWEDVQLEVALQDDGAVVANMTGAHGTAENVVLRPSEILPPFDIDRS
jgi:hypothetical protein